MTVTTFTSLNVGVSRTVYDQSSRLSAALNNSPVDAAAPVREAQNASGATAVTVSSSISAQDPTAPLRVQAVSAALSSASLDVLDSGATQVLRILGQLQSLASRANFQGLLEGQRLQLDGQFQALRISINNVPPAPEGAEFTGASLVGSAAGAISAEDAAAVLGGFSSNKLLGADANLLTEESADQALEVINRAIATITTQREVIGRLQDVAEFTSASVGSALQNQDAQNASFEDFEQSQPSIAAALQANGSQATAVQTSKLPANVLQLLGS